jgi:hypothetical protein
MKINLTRHHLDEDQKYYLIFNYVNNDFKFKIILLASSSHWKAQGQVTATWELIEKKCF